MQTAPLRSFAARALVLPWVPAVALAAFVVMRPAGAEELAKGPAYTAAPLELTYEVHMGGLHGLTVDVRANLDPKVYGMDVALRTDGWLDWMLDFSMASSVVGEVTGQGLVPERFGNESLWKGNKRSIEVTYGDGPLPSVVAVPPAEEDERDPVPVSLREDTIDPMSATLGMIHALARHGTCAGGAAIFDGRRRFDAKGFDEGEAEAAVSDLSPFGGPARLCRIEITPVTGFKKDPERPPESNTMHVYFRQALPGEPALPVRVETETRLGAIRIHLVKAEVAGS